MPIHQIIYSVGVALLGAGEKFLRWFRLWPHGDYYHLPSVDRRVRIAEIGRSSSFTGRNYSTITLGNDSIVPSLYLLPPSSLAIEISWTA